MKLKSNKQFALIWSCALDINTSMGRKELYLFDFVIFCDNPVAVPEIKQRVFRGLLFPENPLFVGRSERI